MGKLSKPSNPCSDCTPVRAAQLLGFYVCIYVFFGAWMTSFMSIFIATLPSTADIGNTQFGDFGGIAYPRYGGINRQALSSSQPDGETINKDCSGSLDLTECTQPLDIKFNNRLKYKSNEYGINPPTAGMNLRCNVTENGFINGTLAANSDNTGVATTNEPSNVYPAYPVVQNFPGTQILPFALNLSVWVNEASTTSTSEKVTVRCIVDDDVVDDFDNPEWTWEVVFALPEST